MKKIPTLFSVAQYTIHEKIGIQLNEVYFIKHHVEN